MRNRTIARELALQALYQLDLRSDGIEHEPAIPAPGPDEHEKHDPPVRVHVADRLRQDLDRASHRPKRSWRPRDTVVHGRDGARYGPHAPRDGSRRRKNRRA